MLEKHQLTGPNFNEWFRALKLVVHTEKLHDVFETALPPAPAAGADAQALADWAMVTELQKMYEKPPGVKLQELVNMFHSCKQTEGQSISDHVLLMKSYLDQLATLNYAFPNKVYISFILNSLSNEFQAFVQNYNLQSMEKTISEVHSLLIEFEKSIKRNKQPIVGASSTPQVMAIQGGRVQKYKPQGKAKRKEKGKVPLNSYPTKPKKPQSYKKENPTKDGQCHHCKEEGHWKMNCPMYLAELMKKKKKTKGQNVASTSLGYPKETMGYYFYYPPENKIVVEMYADFLEKDFILQKESGRIIELEDEDILPSKNTSEHPIEEESLAPIIDPDRLCFNVEVEEHGLWDLNEHANYKAALSDPEFEKWLVAMNAEMQSMYDNKVWRLVVLPPNAKVIKSKWIYKKKTNMNGKVHIYKARLVAKGCTQTYGVDYEETLSLVADIRAIRILISIAAYYDYEIWQMDVKTAFLNGFLEEEIYMEQHEGFIAPNHPRKVWMKRMQNVPYASAVGSIMYDVRYTRPDVTFAQNITSQFQQNSGEAHWNAVKNILKYLRNTKDTFLVFGGDPEAELRVNCYCDAGFKTDRDDTKSQTGSVFVLNRGAVVCKSSKQSTTAQHATEAEYIAASEAAKKAVWIRKFIDELSVVPLNDYPIKINCDNSAAIIMAKESKIQKGARYFKRKYHYVRECIETGEIDIVKVHTDANLADPFTNLSRS
nr:putative retrotransposon protein [Tanacetum cinerariifolium]